VKLPFIKQEDSKDCGVCCLLMMIRYYKGNIPREKLRILTKTSKEGTTAYDLIDAAKKLNFSATGVKGDVTQLGKRDLPCIAHVMIEERYQHYVVIYKVNPKKLLIADPASSFKVITKEEFQKISTNIFLLFSPRKEIPNIEEKKELKPLLLTFFLTEKKYIFLFLLFSFGCFTLSLLGSFQLKYLLEYVINFGSRYNLYFYLILFIGISIIKNIFQVLQFSLIQNLNHHFGKSLYKKVYTHLTSLPYLYYRNHSTGEVLTRLLDIGKLEQILPNAFILLFTEIPFFLIIISILGFTEGKILLLFLVFLTISIVYFLVLQTIGVEKMRKARRKTEEVNSYLTESLLGMETIQSLNYQQKFQNQFLVLYNSYRKSQKEFLKNWNIQHTFENTLEELFLISLLVFCSLEVLKGRMSVGNFIFYHSLCNYLLEPIRHMFSFCLEYKEARDAWNRIDDLLMIPKEKLLPIRKMKNLSVQNIQLENVSYSYNAKKRILNSLSMSIHSGEKILIYGESGGGKSTLARLFSRLLEPETGKILFNGNDIKNYPLSLIREKILYVPQKGYLFTTTILENISCSGTNEVLEKTLEVGKLCMVDELVDGKMEGYHWMIEENGYNLSGGERQRIILARSLFKKASVYIFDESFSELDPVKERVILSNIFSKFPEKTMIMISHRERNQDLFTRKICLAEGTIDEDIG